MVVEFLLLVIVVAAELGTLEGFVVVSSVLQAARALSFYKAIVVSVLSPGRQRLCFTIACVQC
jgi:hypothetical protein